ncbi:MAG TPA: penicillin-binding protein activator LpoB [Thermodesulfobacteriota bacterium]|nr:penicillin-binding protein activator LpoB [Thermodesulfobacteriota bacterium]
MGMTKILTLKAVLFCWILIGFAACATTSNTYRDPNMDFGAVQAVAVMPFVSLARDNVAAERTRDVFITRLLSTGAVYVVPVGEVARGVARTEIANASTPSPEEVVKLASVIKVQAVITGVLKEYGEVRAGTTSANIISVSLQMMEAQTGKVVWSASSTKGGISLLDRLFGGGGQPMNKITEKAVDDLINKLFK